MSILEVKNIEKSYDNTLVLKDISLSIEDGEIISIIGSSGSGKSTLLRCLTRLEGINKGEIMIDGDTMVSTYNGKVQYAKKEVLKKIRLKTGLVFQNFNLFPHYTVLRNIIEAPICIAGVDKDIAIKNAYDLLDGCIRGFCSRSKVSG